MIDDETGKIILPIVYFASEGKEIHYELLLILYNGNERMDTEKIELIIIP